MEKPTIKIWREMKPKHYVGEDCDIVLKYKSNLEKWEIDEIEQMISNTLRISNYSVE